MDLNISYFSSHKYLPIQHVSDYIPSHFMIYFALLECLSNDY